MTSLVPSSDLPNGFAALERLVVGATSISAAVAFVTESGVERLARLVELNAEVEVEVVARAADATTPEALLALRDELGFSVSVVIGREASAFHPKLWLVRSPDRLSVLSGSGNLTRAGLLTNDEQFELVDLEAESDAADAHEERFELLTKNAVRLDEIEGTPIWYEWLDVIKRQAGMKKKLRELEAKLVTREPKVNREDDKAQLLADLDQLYHETVAAKLLQRDGRKYVPSRFKQGIERVRNGADPVLMVARICRRQTDGFNVIFESGRGDLTVEKLVLDKSKPYYDLFNEQTRQLCAERLDQFPPLDAR